MRASDIVFLNFFSSVDLLDDLFKTGTFTTATIRPHWVGLPKEIKDTKLKPGEMVWRMKNGGDQMEGYKRLYSCYLNQ